jgi:hypothetical protein
MTNRVGNKNQAQLRGKQERKELKQANREREALKQATARAKCGERAAAADIGLAAFSW